MSLVMENHKMDELGDQFPIGMRVLAVDDDRTCLKILEKLLLKCKYHVTTAQNAITALNLLRENKNNFDLVISNVHMPDMDGFKLLELIGLEMDLPVIMFSANDDPKMVLKGISHGACDYLLKPVRLKEVQIIWQHVIRKKKKTCKRSNSDSGNGIDSAVTANMDQNEKQSRKRKDHNEEDSEEHEDDRDNEDQARQKKSRVVWSPDLHRKFVDAVHQLGYEKAVPKKILDLMKVEKLTRENVASHLQKYRLYLKKISVENQQANMEAFGAHMQALNNSKQFHNLNNGFNSFTSMSNSFNTPSSINFHNLNSTNDHLKFQSVIASANPNYALKFPMNSTPSLVSDISNNPLMWSNTMQLPGTKESFGHVAMLPTNSQGATLTSTNNVPFQNHDGSYNSSMIPIMNAVESEGNLQLKYHDQLQMKSQNIEGSNNNLGSLEDVVQSMFNQKQDKVKLLDGYLYDNYSGGTSM